MFQSNHTQRRQIHTDVMRKDIDLPWCCGLCDFGRPWMSSLNDTDFSKETDLSARKEWIFWFRGKRKKREGKKIINQLNELWVVDLWLKKKHVHFKHIFLRLQTAVNTSEWWCRTFSVNHANKHSNGNFPFCYQLQVEMRTI